MDKPRKTKRIGDETNSEPLDEENIRTGHKWYACTWRRTEEKRKRS